MMLAAAKADWRLFSAPADRRAARNTWTACAGRTAHAPASLFIAEIQLTARGPSAQRELRAEVREISFFFGQIRRNRRNLHAFEWLDTGNLLAIPVDLDSGLKGKVPPVSHSIAIESNFKLNFLNQLGPTPEVFSLRVRQLPDLKADREKHLLNAGNFCSPRNGKR